jgi:hypothetical protein
MAQHWDAGAALDMGDQGIATTARQTNRIRTSETQVGTTASAPLDNNKKGMDMAHQIYPLDALHSFRYTADVSSISIITRGTQLVGGRQGFRVFCICAPFPTSVVLACMNCDR